MGNYVSCAFIVAAPTSIRNSKVSRVILPSGEIRQFREPVRAAELMLECPGSFVADSLSLRAGRRISALGADEELEFGNVYVMLPMRRVNSVATAGDVAVALIAARSPAKRISGGGKSCRVSPESDEEGRQREMPEMASDGGERAGCSLRLDELLVDNGFSSMEFRHRLSACRSRKPMLETIKEEAVLSR